MKALPKEVTNRTRELFETAGWKDWTPRYGSFEISKALCFHCFLACRLPISASSSSSSPLVGIWSYTANHGVASEFCIVEEGSRLTYIEYLDGGQKVTGELHRAEAWFQARIISGTVRVRQTGPAEMVFRFQCQGHPWGTDMIAERAMSHTSYTGFGEDPVMALVSAMDAALQDPRTRPFRRSLSSPSTERQTVIESTGSCPLSAASPTAATARASTAQAVAEEDYTLAVMDEGCNVEAQMQTLRQKKRLAAEAEDYDLAAARTPAKVRLVPAPKPSVAPDTAIASGEEPACDNEGRPFDLQRVVVNFANVGSTYGERVLKRDKKRQHLMDYEGVRRCLKHLTEKRGLKVVGVVYENFKAVNERGEECWSPPSDIDAMCESVELAPRVTGKQHKSVDDEMTIKCAYNRNCRFLDNDNYREWLAKMPNEVIRKWLESCQEFLQMRFYFDTGLGTFDTLDGNVPAAALAMRVALQPQSTAQASSSMS
eukprot:CAMPEP_0172779728 /NCGR_PEP_ID=MMETSP1074-20121228/202569_1 /TAXON_ID=2916 /ORGANISM="Ceratium fusus, Strain PA161109" /LENGTH=484 /DNA_ID=CAMNT_0013616693 /DNA_START=27 /DNA_END=1477 /DNA_ORIENTATION=+